MLGEVIQRTDLNWQALTSLANSTLSRTGENYAEIVNFPVIGSGYPMRSGDGSVITAIVTANPTHPGWNYLYAPSSSGVVLQTEFEQKNGLDPVLIATIAAAAGLGIGLYATTAEVGAEVGAEASATDLFANESAKFLGQQALAQSGVDLLPTTAPFASVGINSGATVQALSTTSLTQFATDAKTLLATGAGIIKAVQSGGSSTQVPAQQREVMPSALTAASGNGGPSMGVWIAALAGLVLMGKK